MQLKIRDRVFPIEAATLTGGMYDPYWTAKYNRGLAPKPMLALELQAGEAEYDGSVWRPKLYHDWLPFPSRDWRNIGGRKLTWPSAFGAEVGNPNGAMYVFEHADIHEAELVFGNCNGVMFEISWRGICDVFWDQADYGQRVPFEATARARFDHIHLHGSEKDDARSYRQRLALHLDPDQYEQGPVLADGARYEDGVRMTYCVFTPKL